MLEKFKHWGHRLLSQSTAVNAWTDLQDIQCPASDPRELPRPRKPMFLRRSSSGSTHLKPGCASEELDSCIVKYSNPSGQLQCPNCAEVDAQAECNICFEPLQCAGVFSCLVCGHSICWSCSCKVDKCPFCRCAITLDMRFRNIALERFMANLLLPCKNVRWGCTERLHENSRGEHEKQCKFTPVSCPFISCHWNGETGTFSGHMETKHQLSLLVGDGIIIEISKFRSKIKLSEQKSRKYKVSLFCYSSIFTLKVVLYKKNLQLIFMRVCCSNANEENHSKQFGAWIEINSSFRKLKGIMPVPPHGKCMKGLDVSCETLLSPWKTDDEKVKISITIKHLT